MKRYLLLTPAVCVTALLALGCAGHSDSPIRAEVPGGNAGQSHRVHESGVYVLYHVTSFDHWGKPETAKPVVQYTLQSGTRVGFDYVMDKDKRWDPEPQSSVVAYAGDHRIDLGPLHSVKEKYYWANKDGWDSYWSGQPERQFLKAATAQ